LLVLGDFIAQHQRKRRSAGAVATPRLTA